MGERSTEVQEEVDAGNFSDNDEVNESEDLVVIEEEEQRNSDGEVAVNSDDGGGDAGEDEDVDEEEDEQRTRRYPARTRSSAKRYTYTTIGGDPSFTAS